MSLLCFFYCELNKPSPEFIHLNKLVASSLSLSLSITNSQIIRIPRNKEIVSFLPRSSSMNRESVERRGKRYALSLDRKLTDRSWKNRLSKSVSSRFPLKTTPRVAKACRRLRFACAAPPIRNRTPIIASATAEVSVLGALSLGAANIPIGAREKYTVRPRSRERGRKKRKRGREKKEEEK